MASAMFLSLQSLMAPLQAFIDWLAPRPVLQPLPAQPRTIRTRPLPVRVASVARPRVRPLRVVRVFDGPRVPAQAGRMVISGRMADVCAELDRLAAQESDQR
jgi:hypothetical protein